MRVLILGGDGFCGWPLALHLSQAAGHQVEIVDNASRRRIEAELGAPSLTPIATMAGRAAASGITIHDFHVGDLAAVDQLAGLLRASDAVVDLAQIRSAPYSMRSAAHRLTTVANNLQVASTITAILASMPAADRPHLVHIGSAGVYGYDGNGETPEGWVYWRGRRRLHPFSPGSIYHATKYMEATLYEFCARNDGLAITDLHQGIVWGVDTDETRADKNLANRMDWDGDYGTVLNRFVVQAASDTPLSVYGSGSQRRGFIHIADAVACVRLAIETPARPGQYRVFNEVAETRTVTEIASMVAAVAGDADIERIENPRIEAENNALDLDTNGLRDLGWAPRRLISGGAIEVLLALASRHLNRIDLAKLAPSVRW